MPYFAYAGGKVGLKKRVGVIPPLQKLDLKKAIKVAVPADVDDGISHGTLAGHVCVHARRRYARIRDTGKLRGVPAARPGSRPPAADRRRHADVLYAGGAAALGAAGWAELRRAMPLVPEETVTSMREDVQAAGPGRTTVPGTVAGDTVREPRPRPQSSVGRQRRVVPLPRADARGGGSRPRRMGTMPTAAARPWAGMLP